MIEELSVGGASLYLTQVERGTSPLRDNYGLHVGDVPEVVQERRRRLADRIGRPVLWMGQTHSADVALVAPDEASANGGRGVATIAGERFPLEPCAPLAWPALPCDGVVMDGRAWSDAPAVAVMTADCMPVIFSANEGRVVAAVHAGRPGFEKGILLKTLEIFADVGVAPRQISVYIAPAICGECYEVPVSMQEEFAQVFPEIIGTTRWGTPSLDLPRAALAQLRDKGCREVRADGRCTLEDQRWHSHRRDRRSGRQAAIIVPS